MNNLFRFLFGIVLLISITSCGTDPEPGSKEHITKVTNQIDENRLLTADESPGDWLSYGKNYKEHSEERKTASKFRSMRVRFGIYHACFCTNITCKNND